MAFIIEEKGKPSAAAGKRGAKSKPKSAYRVDWTEPKPPLADGTPARGSNRKSLWLGQVTRGMAETVRSHVEELRAAKASQRPPVPRTADWLDALPDELYGKLVGLGLVPRRIPAADDRSAIGLFEFIEGFITGRPDAARRTIINYRQAVNWLRRFFPADKRLADVTPLDVEQWGSFQRADGKSENTVRNNLKHFKTFLSAAVKGRLLDRNPAESIVTATVPTPQRQAFVSLADTRRLLDTCPDADWRAIIALARFGGLRMNEIIAARWEDVDWDPENGRLLVHSKKTKRHGKATRIIPLFPELREILGEAWELAADGAEFIVARHRDPEKNLRSPMLRIIDRAKVPSYGKPFQNLRVSRETELAQSWPLHVVTAWMGNTTTVAAKSYLMVQDSDYATAANSRTESTHKITHKMTGQPAANSGNSDVGNLGGHAAGCPNSCNDLEKRQQAASSDQFETYDDEERYTRRESSFRDMSSGKPQSAPLNSHPNVQNAGPTGIFAELAADIAAWIPPANQPLNLEYLVLDPVKIGRGEGFRIVSRSPELGEAMRTAQNSPDVILASVLLDRQATAPAHN